MTQSGPPDLETLLHGTDAAERERAWERFVADYSRLVLHTIRRSSRGHDEAMDRFAYVLEQLRADDFRRLRIWGGDGRSKLTTWLVIVVQRLCPPDSSSNDVRARDVTAAGHIAGGPVPIVWDPLPGGGHVGTLLPGSKSELLGISPDGNMVVGEANDIASYWTRISGSSWSGPHALTSCRTPGRTFAYAVDVTGLIVGSGCGGATMWRITDGGVTETRLGGLAGDETSQVGIGVSPVRIVGRVVGRAVYWDRF